MKDTNAESIVNTLRTYWKVFNETQEFTEEKFSQLAVAPFIFATSRNNTFILPTLRHIAQFFHVSYTEVYPNSVSYTHLRAHET